MGASRQRVSCSPKDFVGSENPVIAVVGGKADSKCVVGAHGVNTPASDHGGWAANCMDGNDITTAAWKTEILSGSDALRFLCGNSANAQHSQFNDRPSYVKLFSKYGTKDKTASTIENPLLSASPITPSRMQRKAYRPSRLPPPEYIEPLPSTATSVVLPRTILSKTHRRMESRIEVLDGRTANDCCLPSAGNGKKDEQHNPSPQENAFLVCKNLACKAILRPEARFCKRCSCCICKKFDDNKDPSLWITCDREEEGCGLSCHVECALKSEVAGVVEKDGHVWLDGSFVCESCGKITSLIGLWKRQLLTARAARRVDVLCLRLSLGCRLLNGTQKYKEAHSALDDAVKKLEAEVSLMKKDSAKLQRSIVKRLACNSEVQKLIDLSLEHAESLASAHLVVVDASQHAVDTQNFDHTFDYKQWHQKSGDACCPAAPSFTIPELSKKGLVSDLHSCTSHAFKITSFSSHREQEECEGEYFTKRTDSTPEEGDAANATVDNALTDAKYVGHAGKSSTDNTQPKSCTESESVGLASPYRPEEPADNVSNAKTLCASQMDEGQCEDLGDMQEGHSFAIQKLMRSSFGNGATSSWELEMGNGGPCVSRGAVYDRAHISDMNMTNMKNIGDAHSWAMQLHCSETQRPMVATHTEIDRQGFYKTISCIEEFTIRLVRWLECEGHLDEVFRMKFLRWYGFRASEHEKRVVSVFIDTLYDSPRSLAAQLVDAFEETINPKRHRTAELTYSKRAYQ